MAASQLPHYYSELKPFQELFLTGLPILTYHHVGPRPSGVRIKGLYVSPRLFKSQLDELARAGFSAPAYDPVKLVEQPPVRNVLLTFDDGFVDVFNHALPVLNRTGFKAIEFLVSDLVGKTNEWQQRAGDVCEPLMDVSQVKEWLSTGHQIGAHTRTHPRLSKIALETAREEIAGSKKALEDMFGIPVRHFCYPYGDWNPAVANLVAEAGFETACTTEPGINAPRTPPTQFKRFTARYKSRSLRAIVRKLLGG